MSATTYWTPQAWLPTGWAQNVLLQAGADGRWARVVANTPCPAGAERLAGPVLPGLVNAHSHAFQRAFAGFSERRAAGQDDFWSWRDGMYRVATTITPAQLRAVAAQLYTEMLAGGYTEVCEFHYVREAPDGSGDDTLALTQPLIDAAAEVGIGLTLLPVIYERAGFAQPQPRPEQRRFLRHAADVVALAQRVNAQRHITLQASVGVHSLRAAAPESVHELAAAMQGLDAPIHVHVAEQTGEVDDCLKATGRRPVEWLAREGLLDARWQLVHATHVTADEIAAVAASGAGVVICPTTEGNLGDGFTDIPGWLASSTPMAIGSDSHVTRDWAEELRWLEYGQRLRLRQRNVAAAPEAGEPATAARLFARTLAGGAAAAGQRLWGLQGGARADALVLDLSTPPLLGVPPERLLDALVFSSPGRVFQRVMVAGQWREHAHAGRQHAFAQAMHGLWAQT